MTELPEGTLWPLAPHTLGKHLVLRRYLNAWLPIMARRNQHILFIDGFAGPGRYLGGEDGSPVIAIRSLLEHNYGSKIKAQVSFYFIEDHPERAKHLHAEVEPLKKQLGTRAVVEVRQGKFNEAMTEALAELEKQRAILAPAFVMVDPFGVSDTPMSVLERILKNPKSELYVSFMWEFLNRFKTTDEFPPHLDELFGTDAWRPLAKIDNWRDRKNAIFRLYRSELKRRGAKYVLHFELYEGSTLKYAIFFATKHELGCDKMKEAIWHIDPFRGSAFVPGSNDTFQLFMTADLSPLKDSLRVRFGGKPTFVQAMCEWLQTDETFYFSGQLKRVLRELEAEDMLTVEPGTRKKPKSFPDGTVLTLKPL